MTFSYSVPQIERREHFHVRAVTKDVEDEFVREAVGYFE
jgi:hypothetical protein